MSGYLIDPNHPAYPPPDVIEAAEKVGRWFAKHHIVGWQLGPCADRDKVAALLSEIERLRAGWISVEERLPEPHQEVMVWPYPSDYCMTAEVSRDGEFRELAGWLIWGDYYRGA